MPHYDYRCQECGHEYEVFQKMSDPLLKKCEACEGKVERLMSAGSGLIFKGTGFYITDYKNKGRSEQAMKSAANGSAQSNSATETKTPDKTEAKTPAKTEEKSSKPKTEKSTPAKEK